MRRTTPICVSARSRGFGFARVARFARSIPAAARPQHPFQRAIFDVGGSRVGVSIRVWPARFPVVDAPPRVRFRAAALAVLDVGFSYVAFLLARVLGAVTAIKSCVAAAAIPVRFRLKVSATPSDVASENAALARRTVPPFGAISPAARVSEAFLERSRRFPI